MDPYTVQYLSMDDGNITTRKTKNTKQTNQKHKTPNKQNNKQTKTHRHIRQDSSMQIQSSLCANGWALRGANQTQKTKTTQSQGAREGCKKQNNALRKPGVPPARIPKITTRRPQGTTGTSIPGKMMQNVELGISRHPAVVYYKDRKRRNVKQELKMK